MNPGSTAEGIAKYGFATPLLFKSRNTDGAEKTDHDAKSQSLKQRARKTSIPTMTRTVMKTTSMSKSWIVGIMGERISVRQA